MRVLYKQFGLDGLATHTVSIGMEQLTWRESVLDVRRRDQVEWLLRHPSRNYHLEYEVYGVAWDAQGEQVPSPSSHPPVLLSSVATQEEADVEGEDEVTLPPKGHAAVKKRGRPKKR